MQKFKIILLSIFVVFVIVVSRWLGQVAYNWLPKPAAVEADAVGDLFSFLVTLGSIVFFAVLGILIYSVLFYRAKKGDDTDAVPIRGNTKLEIIWTVIPILLVTWIAIYNYVIYQRMDILAPLPLVKLDSPLVQPAYAQNRETVNTITEEETIEVTVKQWSWSFYYPHANVTSTVLHLPVNQRIHLILRSQDVIHGFYVPNFRIKQDIVPNKEIEFSFTPNRVGKYKLHDSQFSGTYFALMEANVLVETKEDYQQWLKKAQKGKIIPAENKALQEHNQSASTMFGTNWSSVTPKEAPLINVY